MMKTEVSETIWLNSTDICSFDHLVEVSGLTRDDLRTLVETGVIQPSNQDPMNYFFHTQCIVLARRARRLRDDFELDADGLALAVRLLSRIEQLEKEMAAMRARLGHTARHD